MDKKIWAFPGKLALYFYILHYPILMLLGRFIQSYTTIFIVLLVVTSLLAALLYLLNDKCLQPFLSKHSVVKDSNT